MVAVTPLYTPRKPAKAKKTDLLGGYLRASFGAKWSRALTFLPHNRRHAVEEAAEFRIAAALIVDEFHFNRFHWRDSEHGLADAGAQAGQQFARCRELSVLVLHLFLECLEGAETAGKQ